MDVEATTTQIEGFLTKYSPDIASRLREARGHLAALFPRGFELVFDNYNALVFAISPNEQASNAFVSIAGYPRWVTLFFLNGASLQDPQSLLEGTGKQIRSVRLRSSSTIVEPAVTSLIKQATGPYLSALKAAPPLETIIKAIVVKQRPRRPSSSPSRPATS